MTALCVLSSNEAVIPQGTSIFNIFFFNFLVTKYYLNYGPKENSYLHILMNVSSMLGFLAIGFGTKFIQERKTLLCGKGEKWKSLTRSGRIFRITAMSHRYAINDKLFFSCEINTLLEWLYLIL